MTWSGLNQRQFPRADAQCDIAIQGPFAHAIHARTENVGVGGVCVILSEELERFSNVKLRLTLKEELPAIECDGRIVWKVRSKEPASGKVSFDTGIEFTNLKPTDKEKVTHYVEKQI